MDSKILKKIGKWIEIEKLIYSQVSKIDKEIVLIPDVIGLINFNNNYIFNSLNNQAARLIQMKIDIYKCFTANTLKEVEYEFISKEIFGEEGRMSYCISNY